jgi:hypothetical protein
MTMKPCAFHMSAPVEAELLAPARSGVTYRRLVCRECGVFRGLRLVRRATTLDDLRGRVTARGEQVQRGDRTMRAWRTHEHLSSTGS